MATPGLERTAEAIVADGKGILAADETPGTLTKRLTARAIESTPDTRRAYREMLFSTPGVAEYITGVILQDETIRQKTSKGTPLADLLTEQGIIPGIKVDRGAKPLTGFPGDRSPQDSTGCAAASKSTGRSARASPSGGP
jgi:fructose-bisphosphate aldolase, class I